MALKKGFMRFTSSLFPRLFARFAYKKLTRPQSHKLKKNEILDMDSSEKSRFTFRSSEIQVYEWLTNKKPPILLVHGWEGQAGNFTTIISHLLAENYSIVAFDAPSHGRSSKNKETSLFEFAEVVAEIIVRYNIKQIISHSFGSVATMYSLAKHPDLTIERYVLLTSPNKFLDRIDSVAAEVGLSKGVKKILIKRLENELQLDLSAVSVAQMSKSVNVKKALILHDADDQVLKISESKAVNEEWLISELEVITGTGHFRILKSQFVLNRITDFFQN